jgi:MoaD family protein
MSVKVLIPTPLRRLTNNREEVEVSGEDIAMLIEDLERQFPGIKERICDEEGKVRRFINIFVNSEDIRFLDGEATKIKDGDEISIIPAIAGG